MFDVPGGSHRLVAYWGFLIGYLVTKFNEEKMMCSKRYGCRGFRGFTLIELLVVISVIALLLAVLMPALRRAKEQAKLVVGGNNQHQVLAATHVYAANNDAEMPVHVAENDNGSARWWDFANYLACHRPEPVGGSLGWQFGGILPNVEAWLCPFSLITPETELPAKGGGQDRTYQEIYEDPDPDEYTWVWMTYMTFWRFGGFADRNLHYNNPAFKGPGLKSVRFNAAPGSNGDLAIADYIAFTYGAGAGAKWESGHPFKTSSKGGLFHEGPLGDTGLGSNLVKEMGRVRFNAGYIDGHVERFSTEDIAIKKPQLLRGRRYFLPENW